MNVTSMLSNGYLQPYRRSEPAYFRSAADRAYRSSGETFKISSDIPADYVLALQERDILAQEQSLRAAAGSAQVSTAYNYAVGADGRRYIAEATVTIKGNESDVKRVTGGTPAQAELSEQNDKKISEAQNASDENLNNAPSRVDTELQAAVSELEQIERDVIAHEAAHQAAAGRFGGSPSYSYVTGPDGKSYIVGGEVPIYVPGGGTPEETLRNMEQVQAAAMAPASPSAQDIAVASQAAAMAAQARSEISAQRSRGNDKGLSGLPESFNFFKNSDSTFKSGASAVQALLRFDRVQRTEWSGDPVAVSGFLWTLPPLEKAVKTYVQNSSAEVNNYLKHLESRSNFLMFQ